MAETSGKISFWGIEIFVAVVEEGSISLAAKRLGVSPSSVSQQVTNMETALGAKLLDRAARPADLTAAGALFLRRAKNILGETALIKADLASSDLSNLTRLRLGVIEDFDADVTPQLVTELAREMKNCQFILQTDASYALASALESRSLDMVVAADVDISAGWMEVYPLLNDPYIIVAPQGRSYQSGKVLEQLKELPFIRYSTRQMMGRQIEAHLARLRLHLPNRFELDSYHAIMAMVASGEGWAITTALGFMRARRFWPDLEVMPLPFAELCRGISLFSRHDAMERMSADIARRLKPIVRQRVVEPCLQELPWLEERFTVQEP